MKGQKSNFIPAKLVQLRILSGMTQEQLSKKLNVSRSCIANYETGKKKPSEEIVQHIAKYFGVNAMHFYNSGNTKVPGKIILKRTKEFIDAIAETEQLDMATISPLSRLALIEFYNFLQSQDNTI